MEKDFSKAISDLDMDDEEIHVASSGIQQMQGFLSAISGEEELSFPEPGDLEMYRYRVQMLLAFWDRIGQELGAEEPITKKEIVFLTRSADKERSIYNFLEEQSGFPVEISKERLHKGEVGKEDSIAKGNQRPGAFGKRDTGPPQVVANLHSAISGEDGIQGLADDVGDYVEPEDDKLATFTQMVADHIGDIFEFQVQALEPMAQASVYAYHRLFGDLHQLEPGESLTVPGTEDAEMGELETPLTATYPEDVAEELEEAELAKEAPPYHFRKREAHLLGTAIMTTALAAACRIALDAIQEETG
ncbi:MAG: hypothetical protein SVW02_03450 [Candidatus Nanohaloarchaea archaeon]|nr:hypothetical protein [Candidatus Nanohaloarchaea archaeon]